MYSFGLLLFIDTSLIQENMNLQRILPDIEISPAGAAPTCLSNDICVYITFYIHEESLRNPSSANISNVGIDKICTLKFHPYASLQKGVPASNLLKDHPYKELGIEPLRIYILENSDWLDLIKEQYPKYSIEGFQHYIITFDSSYFEIISKEIEIIEQQTDNMKEEISLIAERL